MLIQATCKDAPISLFILTRNQITTLYVIGVAHIDEPIENYDPN